MRVSIRIPVLALTLASFAACGGGGGGGGTGATTGQSSFVITDAATDDLSMFEVDLTGITLTPAVGGTVSILAKRQRIDFVTLDTLAEIVAGVTLPLGVYTGMTLTFDFASASAVIKDKTTTASIVDADGNAITGVVTVPVSFGSASRPTVVAAKNHVFMIDLDLDEALTVDSANNEVTFVPAVRAQFDPTNPKPIAATGYLISVDTTNGRFVVENRTPSGAAIGRYTVLVSATTLYQVDGVAQTGSAGLAALDAKPKSTTRVHARGTLQANNRILAATHVESGAGTPGNGQDWVAGLVTARTAAAGLDTSITVLGTSRKASNGSRTFNTAHTVQLSRTTTKVLRRGMSTSLNTDAVNVGQRVWVFGTLSGTTLDARATTGVVRMLKAAYWGTANGPVSGTRLTMNLVRIGLRPVGSFNFTVQSQVQATPATFGVDVTGLLAVGITSGTKVRAYGWMNPVGISGDADCKAFTLDNRTSNGGLLLVTWTPASATGITSAGSIVTLDVSGAAIKNVWDGFGNTALTNTPAPELTSLGIGVFRIVKAGAVEQHLTFAAFGSSLATRLAAGEKVTRITAIGSLLSTTQKFVALVATVVMK